MRAEEGIAVCISYAAVKITPHAATRFEERDPKKRKRTKLMPLVRVRLKHDLVRGVKTDRFGAVHVGLGEGLYAVCYPDYGRWIVATVYRIVV